MEPKFVKLSETMFVNVRHIVSAEWSGETLVVTLAAVGGFMALPGCNRFVSFTGDEAKAAWARLSDLVAASSAPPATRQEAAHLAGLKALGDVVARTVAGGAGAANPEPAASATPKG